MFLRSLEKHHEVFRHLQFKFDEVSHRFWSYNGSEKRGVFKSWSDDIIAHSGVRMFNPPPQKKKKLKKTKNLI